MKINSILTLTNIGEDNKELCIDINDEGDYEVGLYDPHDRFGSDSCYTDFISKDELIRIRDAINEALDFDPPTL
jgi:hypothetical protein